jgi:hypothetical protein
MRLIGKEFGELCKALRVFTPPEFEEMLAYIGRPQTDFGGEGLPFPNLVIKVVGAANTQGWIGELIEAALGFHKDYRETDTPPALLEFIAQCKRLDPAVKPPPEPNPFDTLVMRGGRVFIARDDLRQKLKVIGTKDFSRVMVVNGGKCTGKSYSRFFLNHLKEKEKNEIQTERVVYVDLDKQVNNPEDLLKWIGQPLGLKTVPPRTSEQDARTWVPSIGNWVREGVDAKKAEGTETWWFVLDGFSDKTHESTTYDLIRELATRADLDLQEIRLLLVNYGQRLGGQHLFVIEEKVEEIGEKEVRGFLMQVNDRAAKPYSEKQLDDETANVFAQVKARMIEEKAPEQQRLCYISAEVTRKIRQIFPTWMQA